MERENYLGKIGRGERVSVPFYVFQNGKPKTDLPTCKSNVNLLIEHTETPLLSFSTEERTAQVQGNSVTIRLSAEQTRQLQPGRYTLELVVDDERTQAREVAFRGLLEVEESSA